MNHRSHQVTVPAYAVHVIRVMHVAPRDQITSAGIVAYDAERTIDMARPKKPTSKRKLTATVTVMKTTNKKTPWLLHCSKHGKIAEYSNWTQAAAAKWRHQGQHRS